MAVVNYKTMVYSMGYFFDFSSFLGENTFSKLKIQGSILDYYIVTGCVGFTKASYESLEAQLTRFDSWTLTARILLIKVLFFINKRTRL